MTTPKEMRSARSWTASIRATEADIHRIQADVLEWCLDTVDDDDLSYIQAIAKITQKINELMKGVEPSKPDSV